MLKTINKILLLLIHSSSYFLLLGAVGSWEHHFISLGEFLLLTIIAFACFIFPIVVYSYGYPDE